MFPPDFPIIDPENGDVPEPPRWAWIVFVLAGVAWIVWLACMPAG